MKKEFATSISFEGDENRLRANVDRLVHTRYYIFLKATAALSFAMTAARLF